MRSTLSKVETGLLALCLALLGAALLGPAMQQPGHYHAFADQRVLWGLPFAMDVLSNLPFALAGAFGAYCLSGVRQDALGNVQRAMAWLFFAGLVLTAAASSWYHWHPDDAGLAVDRSGMAFAFAGLLGLAAAGRVSERAGAALGLAALGLALAAAHLARDTGNVLPWALVQFGGMALIVWFACLHPRHAGLDVRWGWVIFAYAAAKLLEMNDHQVYEWTGHLVSGHTLKHAVASLAAWPVIAAVWARRNPGQNAAGIEKTSRIRARRTSHA